MKQLRWLLFLICGSLLLAQQQDEPKIVITPLNPGPENQLVYDMATGVAIATNGVVIRYGTNTTLAARQAMLDPNTGWAAAEGDVSLQNEGRYWRGEKLQYNFKTGELSANQFRVGMPPFYAEGSALSAHQSNRVYSASNARLTTDNVANPAYTIRADTLSITPGQSLEADNATIRLGQVPIFFLPKYTRSLDQNPNQFFITPGYRSLFGPYLLGSYRWTLNTNLSGAFNLDYRQKRGLGFGPELAYDIGPFGAGDINYYYAHDDRPGKDPEGFPIRDDRYRVKFSHQTTIQTNLTAKILFQKQSDSRVIRDFFESDYRDDPQPKSFVEIEQLWPNFSLDLLAQPQVNDFFQTVERLPDVKLTAIRQQIGSSPLFYEGENSAGYFSFQPPERYAALDYAALRADTFHQVLLPWTLFGWLNVAPRVGGRFTHYRETDSDGIGREEQNRAIFNTGAEASFKASRIWRHVQSQAWDVNELRHIIEPSVNYVFVPNPSTPPRRLPQFDHELQSLRLLPVDYPDYNSIDSIDSQNVLRLTLRNKLQTKREQGIDNLVHWALFTDWRIDRRSGQTSFADVFSDLDVKPRSWLLLSSEVRFNVEDAHLVLSKHTATIEPNSVWAISLGHWYIREDPRFGRETGNNLIHSSLYYRLNENWAARVTHHYEARDGVLEEQYYTLYRDLRSWTAALTFRIRDHRAEPDDFTVAITFSLKAFPRYGLGEDRAKHLFLLGS